LHTLNTQSTSDSIYLYQSVSVSIYTVSAFIILTLTPNIPILFTPIPQLSSLVPHVAMDIQNFLTDSTITSGEMCCHAA